jgi:hypothetical protein
MKKVKDYIKKNPEPAKGRFGVNPHDPWSAKYNVAEDLTTKTKGAGDSRSKVAHSPTRQRAAELDKAAKFYQVKNPTGTMGSKVHHEDKHMNKKEGNQNTALTPESVQKCNETAAGTMCEVHGMKACKTINEAKKKMSDLDKWRQASYGREKAHKEFMKSIEHLPHQDQMQKMMDKIKSDRASAHNEEVRGELKHIRNKESKIYNKQVDGFNKKVKEIHAEETITELSAKKLLDYMTKAGSKKDPKKDTKDRSKNTLKATGKYLKKIDEMDKSQKSPAGWNLDDYDYNKGKWTKAKIVTSKDAVKDMGKELNKAFNKSPEQKKVKEETYMDAKAATPAVMSPGEGISEKKTTLQRVMALKKKTVKEDMHDHEKEDKSVATYGKKPKFEKAEKDEGGEKKPQAAAVMTGGTTLTGSKRDTIEIDPMMRNRPGQPDVTKKDDKKDEKNKDKKKDK